jgi:lipopolysaccharide transport system ATP-binding protein
MSDTAIRIDNLSKRYRIGTAQAYDTLRDLIAENVKRLVRRGAGPAANNHIWALKDIALEVPAGEILGVIGHNGAGKSTLLKILSRITRPTQGRLEINGRVASLLEVGTGFHPELTGRENIYMNAAILGMSRQEIRRKLDEIVAFAELEQFIDTPVKRYSSGMYMRLGFSIAAHLEAEILVVDEVLAVGDMAFQRKSLGKMEDVTKQGRTVLFVSHNLASVRTLCNRVLWLENGRSKMLGDTDAVVNAYVQGLQGENPHLLQFEPNPDLRIQLLQVAIVDDDPKRDGLEIAFDYEVRVPLDDVMLTVEIRNADDVSVYYANDDSLIDARKRQPGHHRTVLHVPSGLLAPGPYSVAFGFWQPGHPPEDFPPQRLGFHRDAPLGRLASHGLSWPSVLYVQSQWDYEPLEERV